MKNQDKTKEQLINELVELRQRVTELEAADTERKLAQEELSVAYDTLALSVNGVIIADLEGKIIYANPAFLRMFGYEDRDQVIGKRAAELFPSERVQKLSDVQAIIDKVKGETEEFLARRRDSTIFHVEVSSSIVTNMEGNDVGRMASFVDITKRKRAEERIEHLNAVLRAIRSVNQLIIRERDRDRLLQGACDRLIETCGYDNAWIALMDETGVLVTATGAGSDKEFLPILERLKRGELPDCAQQALSQSEVVVTDGLSLPRADRPLAVNYGGGGVMTVRLEYGEKVYGLLSISVSADFTTIEEEHALFREVAGDIAFALYSIELEEKRKRAEEELGASEQRYRLLFERNLAGVYRSTLDGRILDCNESYARIFGYDSQEEVLALRASELYFDAADRETFIAQLREQGALTNSEWCLRRKDGSPVWVLENASLIEGEEGAPTFIQGTLVAITKRKRAERLLQALNQVALAMERTLTPEEIFTAVASEFKKLGFACVVFLTDESQSKLFVRHFSYGAGAIKALEKLTGLKIENFSIPIETADVYRKVVWERKAAFIENVEDVTRQFLPKPLKKFTGQIVKVLKIAKSIPAPLIVEDEVIGLLSVQSDDLTEDDIPAISAFAYQMAAAWHKANLLQDLERSLTGVEQAQEELRHSYVQLRRTFEGTIHVLTSAIEMRDPYTAGHQQRVTQLACAIAEEMGLPEERIEEIRMAAVVHDLGKISVPAEILSKPGRLTEIEYSLIQVHPGVGFDILKIVEFPWPVAQIVLQHHERLDGSGYPAGLSGKEIMQEARILAVADVVEAMSSHRPYRSALGMDKAIEEISQNRGVLYDPEAADACLKLVTEKGFKFESFP